VVQVLGLFKDEVTRVLEKFLFELRDGDENSSMGNVQSEPPNSSGRWAVMYKLPKLVNLLNGH